MKILECASLAEWSRWLQENHTHENEIWLVFNKKESGLFCLDYSETLDEALCYGWIDSLIKKIDENKYARKFTPRREDSQWSKVNKNRIEYLINAGRLTPAGMAIVDAAKANGSWDREIQRPNINDEIPDELTAGFVENPLAKENFERLPTTAQREYLVWITTAKLPNTRQRRAAEALLLLSQGKRLGLR